MHQKCGHFRTKNRFWCEIKFGNGSTLKSMFSLVTGFKTLKQIIKVPLAPRLGLVDVSFAVFSESTRITPLPTTIKGNLK